MSVALEGRILGSSPYDSDCSGVNSFKILLKKMKGLFSWRSFFKWGFANLGNSVLVSVVFGRVAADSKLLHECGAPGLQSVKFQSVI